MKIVKTLLCVMIFTMSVGLMASMPLEKKIAAVYPTIKGRLERNASHDHCIASKLPSFASICKCPEHRLKYSSYKKAQ